MKLLMTADSIGGVWTYALELCRALGPLGVEVALATLGQPLRPEQREEAAAIGNVALYASAFKVEWMPDPWRDLEESSRWLFELAKKIRPDLVHLNTYAHAALPFDAPVVLVGHSCVLSWWSAVRRTRLPAEWLPYQALVTQAVRAAAATVAPSTALLHALNRHYGPLINPRRIFNGLTRRTSALHSKALHPKQAAIFSAGRLWDEAKNLAALDAAAPGVPWPVFVAGDRTGPDGGRLKTRALRPLGHLGPEALWSWLCRASIYAAPARYEPFGLSILEAAQAGCALVLGDLASLREVWGDAAWYVGPDDPSALRAALCHLIADPQARMRLGLRAWRRSLQFTATRMAAQYHQMYRALISPEPELQSMTGGLSCAW